VPVGSVRMRTLRSRESTISSSPLLRPQLRYASSE
jgi:hypothetical protein